MTPIEVYAFLLYFLTSPMLYSIKSHEFSFSLLIQQEIELWRAHHMQLYRGILS